MRQKGFTLLEMLLVGVIVAVLLTMSIRYSQQRVLTMQIDRSTLQMQQILNAGMVYYVNNGTWPTDMATLQSSGTYLPASAIKSPWGTTYTLSSTNNILSVTLPLPATLTNYAAIGAMLTGRLPLARVSGTNVIAAVNLPGQDLNNANAINFAGLYHHGACVPIPTCPVDQNGDALQAQVFLVPVSVSGINDASSATNVYPISSFTAYAKVDTPPDVSPPACDTGSSNNGTAPACTASDSPSGTFWRACVQIVTERGDVSITNTSTTWGQYVTVAAFVRCASPDEPAGSGLSVYSN